MKTRIIYCALQLILVFVVLGCGKEKENDLTSTRVITSDLSVNSQEPVNRSPDYISDQPINNDRKKDEKIPDIKDQRMIIKTGSLTIEVEKYDETEAKINDIVKKYNGYIANGKSNQSSNGSKSGVITMKVPADKFDAVISDAGKIGKVISQSVQANDVTAEFVDLEARIKTQRDLEQRITKLLNEKAGKLTEVIEVEEKLSSVRQKIESIEGKMKLLRSQSDLSTLTLNINEPIIEATTSRRGFFYEIGQAIEHGLWGLTNNMSASISMIIATFPYIVIILIILLFVRKYLKKRKSSKSNL
ncbi:MAG: DUF4349 domain-containing protein [Ignavibacteriae bacterium]|nr:DUF4349 domain-containing protein [Ignavibacteriota bacterium]